MLSSIAESMIQRIAGRFLKNFSSDNIHVSLTGVVTLTNIELRVEELHSFQMPYTPVRIFFGKVHADLPIVLGGNFDIRASDVLIVVERNVEMSMEPAVVHKALQMWIGAFFFSLAQKSAVERAEITNTEIEYSQKLCDRLLLSLERVHFRVEETYGSHVANPIGLEILCTGLLVDKAEFRNPTKQELNENQDHFKSSSTNSLSVNKLLDTVGLSVYCAREDSCGNLPDSDFGLELVKEMYFSRKVGTILSPSSLRLKFSGVYQRNSSVFGPIVYALSLDDFRINLTGVDFGPGLTEQWFNFSESDEQLSYFVLVLQTVDTHLNRLKLQSRGAQCRECSDPKRRARMRWGMVRDSIKVDWHKYTSTLVGGAMRWRAWCQTWRDAARYVALREILLYHVGFEAVHEPNGDVASYGISECLLMDHHRSDYVALRKAQAARGGMTRKQRRRYQGPGLFDTQTLTAAQILVRRCIDNRSKESAKIHTPPVDASDPLSLSPTMVRALYSLQLEMDTILPAKVAAMCRLWAEDRYRKRRQAHPGRNPSERGSDPSSIPSTKVIRSAQAVKISSSTGGKMHSSTSMSSLGSDNSSGGGGKRIEKVKSNSSRERDGLCDSIGKMRSDSMDSVDSATAGDDARPKSIVKGKDKQSQNDALLVPSSSVASTPTVEQFQPQSRTVLVAIVDAMNLPPSLAMNWVDAYCCVRPINWGKCTATVTTEHRGARVHAATGTALVAWGEVFSFPLDTSVSSPSSKHQILLSDEVPTLRVECEGKGLLAPSYGWQNLTKSEILSEMHVTDEADLPSMEAIEIPIVTHSLALGALGEGAGGSPPPAVIRVMTMVVVGTLETFDRALLRFEKRVSDAVEERKMIVERQRQLEAREMQKGTDEDNESNFILDPSVLTFQDMEMSISISRILFAIEATYQTPVQVRAEASATGITLAHSVPVPILRVDLNDLRMGVVASNNPWRVKGSASFSRLRVTQLMSSKSRQGHGKFSSSKFRTTREPILSIPAVEVNFSATQISTMSRFVGGDLDASCFDWRINGTMYPFSFSLTPQSFAALTRGKNRGETNLWKNYRVLSHLWDGSCWWSTGSPLNFAGMDGGGGQRKTEAQLRLGDAYDTYPKYANALKDVFSSLKHIFIPPTSRTLDAREKARELQPTQATTFSLSTDSSCLDVGINVEVDWKTLLRRDKSIEARGQGDEWDTYALTEDYSSSNSDSESDDDDADFAVTKVTDLAAAPASAPVQNLLSPIALTGALVRVGTSSLDDLGGLVTTSVDMGTSGVVSGVASVGGLLGMMAITHSPRSAGLSQSTSAAPGMVTSSDASVGKSSEKKVRKSGQAWLIEKTKLEMKLRLLEEANAALQREVDALKKMRN